MEEKKVLIEYSSGAFMGKSDPKEKLPEILDACKQADVRFGIQIHNSAPREQVEEIGSWGIPLTIHAPLLGEYIINLAAQDPWPAMESLEITVEWMRRLNVDLAVFHGFIMTDAPIFAFNQTRSYSQSMKAAFRRDLALEGTPTCSNFFHLPEYRMRLERVIDRLAQLRRTYSGLTFAIENDFPLYSSGFLLGDHAAELGHPLCLDTGHLWASAFIFDRDFHAEAQRFLDTGRVRLVHLHASTYTPDVPKTKWRDGHRSLATPNPMDLPRLVAQAKKAGVRHFTFEISDVSTNDIRLFAEMWNQKQAA